MCNQCGRSNNTCWPETTTVSKSELSAGLDAQDVAKALADWSLKYPNNHIYGYGRKEQMDAELKAIENAAKMLIYGRI